MDNVLLLGNCKGLETAVRRVESSGELPDVRYPALVFHTFLLITIIYHKNIKASKYVDN